MPEHQLDDVLAALPEGLRIGIVVRELVVHVEQRVLPSALVPVALRLGTSHVHDVTGRVQGPNDSFGASRRYMDNPKVTPCS